MKQKIRLGDYYTLTKYKLKYLKIRYVSLLAVLTIMCLQARAQQQGNTFTVTGKVISAASGVAIEGVTITNKRTRIHAFTDRGGDYRIPARPDDILVYSFVGYVTTEEEIGGREQIIVALDSAENTLEEVEINAGYYTTTRRTSTGNISRVTAEEIERQPVTNVLGALIGRMPGVNIRQPSGVPGGRFEVEVRGLNSVREKGNDPLFLVDGIPFQSISGMPEMQMGLYIVPGSNPLNVLSPSDIASITVLKDGDATAIYGSRGSNGVILITTKKGEAGRVKVAATVVTGVGTLPNRLGLLSTPQYVEMRKEAFANDGTAPAAGNAYDIVLWDTTRYTDWQETLLGGTAGFSNMHASISGGSQQTQFLLRGSYQTEGSVFPGNNAYRKGSGLLNLTHSDKNDRFRMSASVNYTVDDNRLPSVDLTYAALTLPPNAPALHDAQGDLNWENGTFNNPIQYLDATFRQGTGSFIANLLVEYRPMPRLNLKINSGYNKTSLANVNRIPISSLPPNTLDRANSSVFGNGQAASWIIEPQVEYSLPFLGGSIHAILGGSLQAADRSSSVFRATGFVHESLMGDIHSAASMNAEYSMASQYRYQAVFSRVNFRLKDRYILNLTARRDGSSRFGPGKRFATFGALGGAWIFSEERAIEKLLPFLSTGKLRGSYGITGSDQIGDYGFLETYSAPEFFALDYQVGGLVPTRLANANYAWETNKKLEAGIYLGFLADRITLSTAWFRNRSSNQLVGFPLPATTGFRSIIANFPAVVQNRGWEFELSTTNIRSMNFSWTTDFNFTLPERKLVRFPDIETTAYANQYVVGETMDITRRYQYDGIAENGLYRVVDTDGNGTYSSATDGAWYRRFATRFGGVNNGFTCGNWQLNMFFHFSNRPGSDILSSFPMPGTINNQPAYVMQRWRKEGDDSPVQRFSRGSTSAYSRYTASNAVLRNVSFLRLRNVELSWGVPADVCRRIGLRQVRVYLQGQNLLTFSSYKGLDPENLGITYLPPLRVFTGGLSLTL